MTQTAVLRGVLNCSLRDFFSAKPPASSILVGRGGIAIDTDRTVLLAFVRAVPASSSGGNASASDRNCFIVRTRLRPKREMSALRLIPFCLMTYADVLSIPANDCISPRTTDLSM